MKSSPRLSKEARQTQRPQTMKSVSMLLLATALDTTWRFFGPILTGTFIGIWLDSMFHTAPIFVIILILLGIVGSGLLVAQQLRNVRNQK